MNPKATFITVVPLVLFIIATVFASIGCGSGGASNGNGGSGSEGGGTQATNLVPTLTAISPSSASAGSTSLTITATGANFLTTSSVEWNDTVLETTYVSSTSLNATIDASYLVDVGSAKVTVVNPAPGGGASSGVTFTIKPAAGNGVTTVNVGANDLAWDAVNQKIYLSLPSLDGSTGNSVQILDPTTGALGASAFAGSEPNLLSVSANSEYLYVSLNGASEVQRMTLPGLGTDITITLGTSFYGPYYAMDLQSDPASDGAVAVVRGTPEASPEEEGGVLIYDDTTPRPNVLCGWIQIPACTSPNQTSALYDSIQWNSDGTGIYAANNEDTGFDFYTVPVTSSGFGTVTDYPGLVPGFSCDIHYDTTTKYVYDDDGEIIDPSEGQIVGTFAASGLMIPDGPAGLAFFLGQTQENAGGTTYTLEAFDIQTFTPVATFTVPNVIGTPTHLIRWGTNGLAFTTTNQPSTNSPQLGAVYVISGSFVSNPQAERQTMPTENVQRTWKRQGAAKPPSADVAK